MATVTTQIQIGDSHPFSGGILPTHILSLHENSRPVWILRSLEHSSFSYRFVPRSTEHFLDDALGIIRGLVWQEDGMQGCQHLFRRSETEIVSLEDDSWAKAASIPVAEWRQNDRTIIGSSSKLIFTILNGSSLETSIDKIMLLPMDFEICVSHQSKGKGD